MAHLGTRLGSLLFLPNSRYRISSGRGTEQKIGAAIPAGLKSDCVRTKRDAINKLASRPTAKAIYAATEFRIAQTLMTLCLVQYMFTAFLYNC